MATHACKQGKVKINGANVKPSREVYATDKITVRKEQVDYVIEVLDLPTSRVGAKIAGLYVNDITPPEAFANKELLKYSQEYYRKKGTGRPTKKDRRDIDDLLDNSDEDISKPGIEDKPE